MILGGQGLELLLHRVIVIETLGDEERGERADYLVLKRLGELFDVLIC